MECGDLSPLWLVATCRDHVGIESGQECGVKPPQAKAVTGHRTPKSLTLLLIIEFRDHNWRRQRFVNGTLVRNLLQAQMLLLA